MSKTKAELKAEIEELKSQLENAAKQEQSNEFGAAVMSVYQGFITAGFTKEEAWELLKLTIIKK
jgi:hypothetical protein